MSANGDPPRCKGLPRGDVDYRIQAHPRHRSPILVAGGGIGGLATALALARGGVAVRLLERHAAPSETGAGIQIGPNGMRILAWLGVAARLEPLATAPRSIRIFDGRKGRLLTELPLGSWIEARHGAPYRAFHRADLHAALLQRTTEEPLIDCVWGFDVAEIAQDDAGVSVSSAEGATLTGRALIGADGLWSRVRREVAPSAVTFSRRAAARALVDASGAAPVFSAPSVGLWLGPRAHIVHYPVRAGAMIAIVVVFDSKNAATAWDGAGDAEEISRAVAGFAPELTHFLALARSWRKWSLYDPVPLPRWTKGRVTLVGDAAHPILPYLAQGGALALEDALALAASLTSGTGDIRAAFAAYEEARRPRAARVQAASRRNGWVYHLAGPLAAARNRYLRTRKPESLMAGYDWLYEYQW